MHASIGQQMHSRSLSHSFVRCVWLDLYVILHQRQAANRNHALSEWHRKYRREKETEWLRMKEARVIISYLGRSFAAVCSYVFYIMYRINRLDFGSAFSNICSLIWRCVSGTFYISPHTDDGRRYWCAFCVADFIYTVNFRRSIKKTTILFLDRYFDSPAILGNLNAANDD